MSKDIKKKLDTVTNKEEYIPTMEDYTIIDPDFDDYEKDLEFYRSIYKEYEE